jgi:hypothetical protein
VALLHDCICVKSDTIEFRGFSIDAEVATLTYEYLTDTMERSLKLRKQEGSVSPGRSASFDYRVGFALAVLARARLIDSERKLAEEKLRDAQSSSDVSTGNAQGLMILKREVVRRSCMNGVVAGKVKRVRYRNGEAHTAGTSDGAKVSLDKQVSGVTPKAVS